MSEERTGAAACVLGDGRVAIFGGMEKQMLPAILSTRNLSHRFLSRMASYDVTSNICLEVNRILRRGEQ